MRCSNGQSRPLFGNSNLVLEKHLVPVFRQNLWLIVFGWGTRHVPILEPMIRDCISIQPILHQNLLHSFNGLYPILLLHLRLHRSHLGVSDLDQLRAGFPHHKAIGLALFQETVRLDYAVGLPCLLGVARHGYIDSSFPGLAGPMTEAILHGAVASGHIHYAQVKRG